MNSPIQFCNYCQGNFVYSNNENGDTEIDYGDEDSIIFGVYDSAIMVKKIGKEWHLLYSDGVDHKGEHEFSVIGAEIKYCPNCGRKLQ